MIQVREELPPADEFDEIAFVETLRSAVQSIGVPLSEEQIAQCVLYTRLLLETNAHTNLTRITEAREMAVKHFADSLTVLGFGLSSLSPHPFPPASGGERGASKTVGATASPTGETFPSLTPLSPPLAGGKGWGDKEDTSLSLCDVGTGAGFPGIVLKIARPDLQLTLLDSLQKRLTFLEKVCTALGFTEARFVHARAEEAGRDRMLRERFDMVTARAVASLPTLLEWCTPLVKPGGHFVAMKSGNVDEELVKSSEAATALKVRLVGDRALTLPTISGSDEPPAERRILTYRKTVPTPARFPRSSAEIKRNPL